MLDVIRVHSNEIRGSCSKLKGKILAGNKSDMFHWNRLSSGQCGSLSVEVPKDRLVGPLGSLT